VAPWAADTWPKCAYYAKGLGRWAVEGMSECPLKLPFTPLGAFITRVGQPPSRDALTIYLQRMREHGWDVLEACRRLQQHGFAPQVRYCAPAGAGLHLVAVKCVLRELRLHRSHLPVGPTWCR
jgi:hypothetical protein